MYQTYQKNNNIKKIQIGLFLLGPWAGLDSCLSLMRCYEMT